MSFLGGRSGGSSTSEEPVSVTLSDLYGWMRAVLNSIVRPVFLNPTNGTVMVSGSLTSAGTVSTVSTVTSVTTLANQTNIGGFDAKLTELYDLSRATWASNVRSRIS